jgi:hypothetical protein
MPFCVDRCCDTISMSFAMDRNSSSGKGVSSSGEQRSASSSIILRSSVSRDTIQRFQVARFLSAISSLTVPHGASPAGYQGLSCAFRLGCLVVGHLGASPGFPGQIIQGSERPESGRHKAGSRLGRIEEGIDRAKPQ